MDKNKKIDKINNLRVNLACFGLGVALSSFVFTGYNLTNSVREVSEVEFEPIEIEEAAEVTEINHTRYEDVIQDEFALMEHEYSGMALDNEFEDYIRELCDEYASQYELDSKKLFESTLVIGDTESNGTWECNGKISSTNDYGEFQINISNHNTIRRELGFTSDELLNDREKNAEAAVWIISNIMTNDSCKTDEDIYGMYNGWTGWKNKDQSVVYVASCMERHENYFPEIKYLSKR